MARTPSRYRDQPALRILIVRHGESTFNLENRIQGRSDLSRLTPTGEVQAQRVAEALAGIPLDCAYCSPLSRALDTARIILKDREGIPLHITDQLREIDLTAWEGLTFAEVKEKYPEDYHLWRHHPDDLELEGRFPVRNLWQQAQGFWEMLAFHLQSASGPWNHGADPSQRQTLNILIVGHSGINRALVSTAIALRAANATGLGPHHYHCLGQDNCAISVLNFPEGLQGPPQLESLNITAHLGQALPKRKQGMRILLVRHGETQWNRERRFQGQRDIPLNATGEEQAAKVAECLATQPLQLAFSSPLKRSWATADAICSNHSNLILRPMLDLQEICHGDWEGKLQSEVEAEYPGELERWQRDPASVQMPNGENLHQVWERTRSAWQEVLATTAAQFPTQGTAVVVAHDAINKAIICQLFNLSPQAFWIFKQGNGAITVIDYPEGKEGAPVLKVLNLTTHLSGQILDCTTAGAL
ncbi:MAG TPA: histidine phosphatase family protein [Synechococcus sp. M44_DOE_062]|nr:histidine phosphatase family protein [Synechococcus sp. M44_DOE_062]